MSENMSTAGQIDARMLAFLQPGTRQIMSCSGSTIKALERSALDLQDVYEWTVKLETAIEDDASSLRMHSYSVFALEVISIACDQVIAYGTGFVGSLLYGTAKSTTLMLNDAVTHRKIDAKPQMYEKVIRTHVAVARETFEAAGKKGTSKAISVAEKLYDTAMAFDRLLEAYLVWSRDSSSSLGIEGVRRNLKRTRSKIRLLHMELEKCGAYDNVVRST